ncbi:MAG: oxygen-independent coproporphyrinogen III oxidase [Deinococcales bacterium]
MTTPNPTPEGARPGDERRHGGTDGGADRVSGLPHGTGAAADRETLRERVRRLDRPGPRYTSYPTAVEFTDAFDEDAYRAALARAAQQPEVPLALYTHLPFCAERCLYCACNVVITPHLAVADAYLERLYREIDMVAPLLGDRRDVAQFHLGGGTPTYYGPDALTRLMEHYRKHFRILPGAEVALEVDPRVTSVEHLERLAELGFNRLSLGVQDFDEDVQRTIGRVQSVEQTAALMEAARRLGFGSTNLDLIYGLPYQKPDSLARTLDRVLELRPDRLAVYSFAFLPKTHLHQRALPEEAIPRGEAKLALLELTRERLLAGGYVDVGMDHFALPEDDLVRAQREGRLWRNFMGYTTSRAPDMVGFGVSAIGEVGGAYVQNEKKLNRYEQVVDAGRVPVARGVRLDDDDRLRQQLIRDWMCHFRVDKRALEQRFGIVFDRYFARELQALVPLAEEGLVRFGPDRLEAGELGRLLPRNVAMVFDRYLQAKSTGPSPFSRTV